METPSSTRRLTRSQTIAALNNTNISSSEDKGSVAKSRRRIGGNSNNEQDRCALIDITNDSPIVGVALVSRSETPLSGMMNKQRSNRSKMIMTPGSGEALLRGQVKALLQKVEEEGGEISKISLENRPFLHLQGFVNSPTGLLAPTPANTPQILNLSGDDDGGNINGGSSASITPLPVIEEQLKICQVVGEMFDESQKSVTRSLLLDFSEKSDSLSSVSVVTTDEDSGSNWSIQVNASTHDEEDVEEEEEEEYFEEDWIDEVCEGVGKISIESKFEGKYKKFEYDSDDEIIVEEGANVLHLKGVPTPKGKHVRFPID
ncbi:uncharacterized protein [Euphorbia lathyris]|uniref:uncharacterized protein n=1 Tax=Euphorbia lathyris TaxID=212925 RepID=UPI00331317E7